MRFFAAFRLTKTEPAQFCWKSSTSTRKAADEESLSLWERKKNALSSAQSFSVLGRIVSTWQVKRHKQAAYGNLRRESSSYPMTKSMSGVLIYYKPAQ